MKIAIIAAVADNGIIGNKGELPWSLKADLARFARQTKGHSVIMGRKTFEAIQSRLGRPLPGRVSVILTHQKDYPHPHPDCFIAWSWAKAVNIAKAMSNVGRNKEVFVIGGAEIFRLALPCAKTMYLTQVHCRPDGDTFFPEYDPNDWEIQSREEHRADAENNCDYDFVVLGRRNLQNKPDTAGATTGHSFVNLANARHTNQAAVMEKIAHKGICPFCPGNAQEADLLPIIKRGRHWHVRQNRWPYGNARVHLLFILNTHAEELSELSAAAAQELMELARWAKARYRVSGGGLGLRFGDTRENGGTVAHLHAHFICAELTDRTNPRYKPVRFRVG